jgi:uncharacterized membrane protein YraQ (UPF0718 family)
LNKREALSKSVKPIWNSLPVLVGVILLVSLANATIPKSFYKTVLGNIPILDSIIGSAVGSILAGNPITSYVIGGELLTQGVGLMAVTAFIIAWVTVGVVQLPAESMLLGKRFALIRNAVSFVLSIVAAAIVVCIMVLL